MWPCTAGRGHNKLRIATAPPKWQVVNQHESWPEKQVCADEPTEDEEQATNHMHVSDKCNEKDHHAAVAAVFDSKPCALAGSCAFVIRGGGVSRSIELIEHCWELQQD